MIGILFWAVCTAGLIMSDISLIGKIVLWVIFTATTLFAEMMYWFSMCQWRRKYHKDLDSDEGDV